MTAIEMDLHRDRKDVRTIILPAGMPRVVQAQKPRQAPETVLQFRHRGKVGPGSAAHKALSALPMGGRGPGSIAGFVLAGGRSSRMGRDKALMAYGDHTLIEHIARVVERACGSAVLVGCPERYRALPYPAIKDALPEQGPLGGIQAALCASSAEWNLVVACDMPLIIVELLESLLVAARECDANCLVPVSPDGRLQPLCALYRRRCLGAVSALLERGVRKMRDAILQLDAVLLPMPSAEAFRNVNTPREWKAAATPVEHNAHDH